ncbi:MAG: hypothetical protein ABSA30_04865, partial [Candidatus Aminicenantales bacterium]
RWIIAAFRHRKFFSIEELNRAIRELRDRINQRPFRKRRPPSENGTPQPKDEPFAENPPYGAVIDYYLKSRASGPVTLEIIDAAGQSIRRYASDDKIAAPNPATLNVAAVWVATPAPLPAEAGHHRWVWDLRSRASGAGGQRGETGAAAGGGQRARAGGGYEGRGGGPSAAPGTYTVKLTVDGQTFTQPLTVKPDPRQKNPAQ